MIAILLLLLLAMSSPAPENAYLKEMRARAKAEGGTIMRVGDTPSMLGSGINNKYIAVISQPDYEPGDLVVFKDNRGKLTIHPITHKKPNPKAPPRYYPMGADDSPTEMAAENMFYTKGTFNRMGDGWIPHGDIVGKTKVLDPEKPVTVSKAKEKTLAVK